ncbi:alpha-L-fucosidase [Catalinimonas alkaloidigena]|uniref:alpha-L-fucosidase n=1 Tax=Catalinimonas alkaloidigena TaxID=1075417 RepID=UPI002405A374|nr:alpha-L-fucosidase [Catalinimonas alkaloidigena]MDF9796470.1 alpha-L-fucosidase [Catalinimonas alkaloidigena]
MKHFGILTIVVSLALWGCNVKGHKQTEEPLKSMGYEENWESLKKYEAPDWFKDAKLGIFIHWGPYAVPAFGSEWYPRLMYQDSVVWSPQGEVKSTEPSHVYKHHVEYWGHPSEFGYKDFIPLFKAENFDADAWVDLFEKAGAKYIVPVAEHHDAFAMYDSKNTKWNSVNMGPKRDILGELAKASKAKGLKFGASSHLAFNYNYFNKKKEFDTANPEYADLYNENMEPYSEVSKEFQKVWWNRTKDIIDNYQPDILWFDFYLDRPEFAEYHPKLAAYYYNKGLDWNKEVVLQDKNFDYPSFPEGTIVLDLERGKMSDINKEPWQTDTSIGKNSWGYVTNWISKTPNTLIDDLIDIVSKNGCLLLNVGPKADGTIPEDQQQVLLEIGKWLNTNGDAIYGTRPWKIYGEGPTEVATGHHTEGKNQELTANDFRFTTKNGKLYAIAMDWPENGELLITSLAEGAEHAEKVSGTKLLGSNDKLQWEQTEDGLMVRLPENKPGEHAFAVEVSF